MKFDLKKTLITTAILAFGTLITVFSSKSKNKFAGWLETASDDELSDEYEERRQEWARNGFGGNGEKTPEMKRIDREIDRRSAERRENNPRRNTDPGYRWTDANRWDKD